MTELPPQAIATDRRLDDNTKRANEDLAKHRWHWTLDETNPDRVSIRAYARDVGRAKITIQNQVKGYAAWTVGGRARPLGEEIERAGMSGETEAATAAVAKARGTSFKQARESRPTEVRRVREIARERAEKHGTSVEEETEKVADWNVKAEKATTRQQTERAQRHSLRFIDVEGHLNKALRSLTDALNASHGVPWETEERELLNDTISKVRALLDLVDLGLSGTADVDWDAELAKITP